MQARVFLYVWDEARDGKSGGDMDIDKGTAHPVLTLNFCVLKILH